MKQFLAVAALLTLLPACSTVAGVGKDVSAAGRGLTHVADEVRDEVFTDRRKPRYVESRYPATSAAGQSVIVKQPCDPNYNELRGGNGLPPCPDTQYRYGR